jgi:glycosyltransferase involved in cell wall biosynthesis
MKVVVVQKAAREHFLTAHALHRQGMLAGLVTDWYAFAGKSGKWETEGGFGGREVRSQNGDLPPLSSVLRRLSSVVRHPSARAAQCEAIPDELVQAFPVRSLFWKWRVRRLAKSGRLYTGYAQTDRAFAAAVARLKLPTHDVFFGYAYASLEMLQAEKSRGKMTILCQIDPGPAEFRLVVEEMRKHPEIAGPPTGLPDENIDRNRREWELADIIIVNSDWSRQALISEGVPPAKIEILPLAFEPESENLTSENQQSSDTSPRPSPQRGEGVLRVLWLGQVNVRKGIHYLMAAARLLERENIQFDMVGPVNILPGAVAAAPRNMTFHGPVSRDRAAEWYRQSDVFVLPTLSDGFALTQLEALAHGLPVIVTPNCGGVVTEGQTGFVIPARDPQALAAAILKFIDDRRLSAAMAPRCRVAVKAYSVEAYGRRLVEIIGKYSAPRLCPSLAVL